MTGRRTYTLEQLEFFTDSNDAFFVLPGPRDAAGRERMDVVRVVLDDSAPRTALVN